jgi:tRNA pseudouridine55 synthase
MQTPPAFSAIMIDGERAYDLARAGETVVLEPRPVVIESLTLLAHTGETSELSMTCEKGTYVRALARDLARALGSRGHVVALHRAQVGPFSDVIAVTIEQIERNLDAAIVPVASGLIGLPEVRLTAQQAQVLRHGNPVLLTGATAPIRLDSAWASEAGSPVALGYVEAGHFHPQRVLLG